MTEIDIPLFTIFNLICRYNFHPATLVLNPNVSHAAETRPNIHHPCSACRGIRQEPLDSSPDILQNFYERLSQSPNIMPPSLPSFFCSQYFTVWLSSVRFPLLLRFYLIDPECSSKNAAAGSHQSASSISRRYLFLFFPR